jgi:DDE superfamily endonuclease
LGFADEMRVGLRGMVRRVWGRRGGKVHQRLQLAYYWRYLFLVVNAQAGQLHWCWLDSMAGEQMVAAVGGLKKHTEVATLVWDGAPGHQDEWVRELGMPLIGLPPYTPELNPAERVFQEVRRAIEGKVYATLEEKMIAVAEFLRELEAEPERVRSLTWWDWIKAAVQQLPISYAASSKRLGIRQPSFLDRQLRSSLIKWSTHRNLPKRYFTARTRSLPRKQKRNN